MAKNSAFFVTGLNRLTNGQRKLLVYRGLEGLRHQEVASIKGLATSAVEKRWRRLLEQLKAVSLPKQLLAE